MRRRDVLKGCLAASFAPYLILPRKSLAALGQYRLNGLGAAGGRITQPDLSTYGLTAASVFYADDIGAWVSSGRYAAGEVPSDSDVATAAANCSTPYCILDIENWDHTTEASKYITTLQKFRAALPSKLIGGFNLGLDGYIALTRCTSPHGNPSAAYSLFQSENTEKSAFADYVDFYMPAFYLEKAIPVSGDPYTTAQCWRSEITRLGIANKPIVPWIWAYYSSGPEHNAATISAATQANPVRLTVSFGGTGSNINTGDRVWVEAVSGMTQLNNAPYLATKINATTYDLYNTNGSSLNGTGFSAYTANGKMYKYGETWLWRDMLDVCNRYLDGYILWAKGTQQDPYDMTVEPYMRDVREVNASVNVNSPIPYGYTLKPKKRRN